MKPLISITIATYNEEKYIGKLLDDLLEQNINIPFEILIVDGKSEDKTTDIVKNKMKKHKNVRLLINKKRKPAYAFNIGLEKGKGEYFMLLGAHTTIPKNFLKNNYESIIMQPENVAAVGGKLQKNKTVNKFGEAVDYVTSTYLGGGVSKHRYSSEKQYTDTVVFGLYRKKNIGKQRFDLEFVVGQDLEFNIRLLKKGYKLLFDPKIQCIYHSRNSPKKLAKQMWNYGVARIKIMQKHNKWKIAGIIPLIFSIYLISTSSIFKHQLNS